MKEKIAWPYYIWMYFNILKKLNSNYRKLNNLDGKHNNNKRELLYYDMFEEITQIIPYRVKGEKIRIRENEGILELLNDELSFVKEYFENMLASEKEWLSYIKRTRNNIEHSPHRLLLCAQTGTKGHSNITLNYMKQGADLTKINWFNIEYCYCDSVILGKIISELNELFKQIRKEINKLEKEKKIENEIAKIYSRYRLNSIA